MFKTINLFPPYQRVVARDRGQFSYTEALLDEFDKNNSSVNVISETLPGVDISCRQELLLYRYNTFLSYLFHMLMNLAMQKSEGSGMVNFSPLLLSRERR